MAHCSIKNRLLVGASVEDADLQIRTRIALSLHQFAGDCEIYVFVQHGKITLIGEVVNYYDQRLIVDVARHVAGALKVEDELTIVESLSTASAADETLPLNVVSTSGSAKRRILRRLAAAFAVLTLMVLPHAGCGKSDANRVPVHPVQGAIKFRGQAMPGAFVSLHREGGEQVDVPSPRATVAPDGSFALGTYDGTDGAPEGEYVLTVQWYKPVKKGNDTVGGPNVLPRKYASVQTSDVRVRVAAGENRLQPIQLR